MEEITMIPSKSRKTLYSIQFGPNRDDLSRVISPMKEARRFRVRLVAVLLAGAAGTPDEGSEP